jgi:hypothetical protein
MNPWWAEYPECIDAHNKAVKAYRKYLDSINDEILAMLERKSVMYLTPAEVTQLDSMLDNR